MHADDATEATEAFRLRRRGRLHFLQRVTLSVLTRLRSYFLREVI